MNSCLRRPRVTKSLYIYIYINLGKRHLGKQHLGNSHLGKLHLGNRHLVLYMLFIYGSVRLISFCSYFNPTDGQTLPICKYSTPIIVNTSCLCTRNVLILFECPSMVSVLVSCRQFPEILKCLVVHLSHTCGLMGSSYPFCVQKRSLHCGF